MNEISRVIPASDYIDAVPAQDVIPAGTQFGTILFPFFFMPFCS
jgi:hypothetical protein